MYFCKGYDCGEKVDLSKGYWHPKRQYIIKSVKCKECMATSFQMLAQLSVKNAQLPPIFFLDSDSPC